MSEWVVGKSVAYYDREAAEEAGRARAAQTGRRFVETGDQAGDQATSPAFVQVSASCSWCHASNPARERFCGECGHEAHVARMDCACPKCRRPAGA